MKTSKVVVGSIVEPVSPEFVLASGCGRYPDAVVVSVEPFVLVSRESDMKWQATVKIENFIATGQASDELMAICNRRI